MRAWTNQLSSISHLLMLPFALILIMVIVATVAHSEANQTQPIATHSVSTFSQNKSGVDLQKAYVVPAIADDYTGDTHQQLTNSSQSTTLSSSLSSKSQSVNNSDAAPTASIYSSNQSTTSVPSHNDSLSSKLNVILSTIILGPQAIN